MRREWHKSITLRLTLLFALTSTCVLFLLGILIGDSVERHFEEQDMEILTDKLDLMRHALEKVHSERDWLIITPQLDDTLPGNHGLATAVTHAGQTVFASRGVDFPQAFLQDEGQTAVRHPVVWKTGEHVPWRGISARVSTGIDGAPPAIVAVATDISHHEHFMHSFRITLWSFMTLAAILTGFLGWAAVRRGLLPLQAIRQQAESITAQRLDARLPIEAIPLELMALGESFNAMLSRLEESFRRLSDFSSDLAHEFRTPISNLLTQTQVTLSKPRTLEEYREVLASNVEEFERLARMIADMLFIAKADEGRIVPQKEGIELAQVSDALIEFYRLLAEEKSVFLTRVGTAQVMGDPLMVRRAISNLLSNALRHTPAGGRITVRIETNLEAALLSVENTGKSISPSHLHRLFDRFYRTDTSRRRDTEGSGLGLAITRSIMNAHGGSITVRSEQGVTVFCLRFDGQR